jgi:3-deoxy-manno-octulosonate cytidylyltransferase (CMP-KDO synthetase)
MIKGMSMIERVYRLAKASQYASKVIIATDDLNLKAYVQSFGAPVVLTSSDCKTGTDRVAQAYEALNEFYPVIFNLQGDAVLTPPWVIDALLKVMLESSTIEMATPIVKLSGEALTKFVKKKQAGSSSGTCCVFDKNHNAMYFSKTIIPNHRDNKQDIDTYCIYQHIGLYAYTPECLKKWNTLEQTPFEKIEQLEPLRALENGMKIRVVPVDYQNRSHGSVDNPEDVAMVETLIENEGELVL